MSLTLFCHINPQLLDVCRRLDAADANGYADPRDEMEAATLRVLLGVG